MEVHKFQWGIFYLVGYSIRMEEDKDGRKYPHCCGYIARRYSQDHARLIAADAIMSKVVLNLSSGSGSPASRPSRESVETP